MEYVMCRMIKNRMKKSNEYVCQQNDSLLGGDTSVLWSGEEAVSINIEWLQIGTPMWY